MVVFESTRSFTARDLADRPSLACELDDHTLRTGRQVLFGCLEPRSGELRRAISARIFEQMPHQVLNRVGQLIRLSEASVRDAVRFGLACVHRGPAWAHSAPLPQAPFEQARQAAHHGVPADVLNRGWSEGFGLFWERVCQTIRCVDFPGDPRLADRLRLALVDDARAMQGALLPRIQHEIAAEHERALSSRLAAAGLTRRELEIFGLLQQGCSDEEISQRLHIAWGTARRHTSNLMAKVGISDRRQAMLMPPMPAAPPVRPGEGNVTRLSCLRLSQGRRATGYGSARPWGSSSFAPARVPGRVWRAA